jgi:hypothetical protein
MTRAPAFVAFALACTACTGGSDQPRDHAAATTGCPTEGGYLRAQLRGAITADVDWSGADMQCEGSPRPDGHGIRLTFAGRLPASPSAANEHDVQPVHQLRFIFGIDERDIAAGAAQAMPTNLTVILEGEKQLFATRGDQHCAVESLERTPLTAASSRRNRVHARGYCLAPATNAAGDARLLVPTFEFTGVADTEL